MDAGETSPFAIVGLACRLPGGVRTPEALWDLLIDERDTWSPVPGTRFNEDAFYHPNSSNGNGTTNHRGGHFLDEDLSLFDNEYFHIPPQQAASMDPQQRMSLEVVSEALENAGLPRDRVAATKTAVYMAMFSRDYDRLLYRDPLNIPTYLTTGVGDAILANRISHALDLRGPSMTLDTGCSGSLVSVHQACMALQVGDADVAIAGSANLIFGPDQQFGMTNVHMLNEDGRSYPFDERGSGYGRGEGIAAIIIKRLEDALRDRDHIHAVIRSSAINQDGYTAAGITRPSAEAQAELQLTALARAGLQSQDVTYVEAHGTGTKAGDEAEFEGLSRSYGHERTSPLYIGSIKGNIGHTESTSGLAGLIKVVLSLKNGKIPPTILAQRPKESLKLYSKTIQVVNKTMEWPKETNKIASVNSFGYGGTNAHIILSASDSTCMKTVRSSEGELANKQLMVFSAASADSLRDTIARYHDWLQLSRPGMQFSDFSYTLSCRRSHLPWKFACVAGNFEELAEHLRSASTNIQAPVLQPPQLIWVFTGQGSQWTGMAVDLLNSNDFSIFTNSMARSRDFLMQLGAKWNLFDELMASEDKSKLMLAEYAQPSTTAIQIALVDVLRSLNVTPQAVIGHSSGEIAAAYAAGYLEHADAIKIAHCRGTIPAICQDLGLPSGAMLAVGLGERDVQPYLSSTGKRFISIACINSPKSTTLSGDKDSITEVARRLSEDGVFNRALRVDLAYHSEHMRDASEEYRQELLRHNVRGNSHGIIPFFSTVSGSQKSDGFDASYWVANLVSPVKFQYGFNSLTRFMNSSRASKQSQIVLELGAHSAIGGPIRQCGIQGTEFTATQYVPSFKIRENAISNLLDMTAQLFIQSVPINLEALRSSFQTAKVMSNLPSYAWNHQQSHWWESWVSKAYRFRQHPYHDLLGLRNIEASEPTWRHRVSLARNPWLADHQIGGVVTFPGAGYLSMTLEAARQAAVDDHSLTKIEGISVNNIKFCRTLVIPTPTTEVEMQLRLTRQSHTSRCGLQYDFSIYAMTAQGSWLQHCYGSINLYYDQGKDLEFNDTIIARNSPNDEWQSKSATDLYEEMKDMGNIYGPTFTGVTSYRSINKRAEAEITIPDIAKAMPMQHISSHLIHPSTLDVIMHSTLPLAASNLDSNNGAIVPTGIQELWLRVDPCLSVPEHLIDAKVNLRDVFARTAITDVEVVSKDNSQPLLSITGMELRSLAPKSNITPNAQDSTFVLRYSADIDFATQPSGTTKQQGSSSSADRAHNLFSSVIHQHLFKNPNTTILEIGTSSTAYKTHVEDFRYEGLVPAAWSFRTVEQIEDADLGHYDLIIWDDVAHDLGNSLESIVTLASLLNESAAHLLIRTNDLGSLSNSIYLDTDGGHAISSSDPQGVNILNRYNLQVSNRESSSGLHGSTVLVLSRTLQAPTSALPCEVRALQPLTPHLSDFVQQLVGDVPGCSPLALDIREPLIPGSVVIVIDDGNNPLLTQNSSEVFESVRNLVGQAVNILWVTVSFKDSQRPTLGRHLITGFARTAHAENQNLSMIIVDVHMDDPTEQTAVIKHLTKCIASSFGSSDKKSAERELVYRQGEMRIPRLLKSESLSNWINPISKGDIYYANFSSAIQHLVLDIEQSVNYQRVIFRELHSLSTGILEDEVELSISYCAAPALTSKQKSFQMCSGVVTAIGQNVHGIAVGDEVFAMDLQTQSNKIRAPVSRVHKVERSSLQIHNVVGLYDLMVAIYSFESICQLLPGQTILIDGPMDSTKQIAIVVAHHKGSQVIVAAQDEAEYDRLVLDPAFANCRILAPGLLNSSKKLEDSLDSQKVSVILTGNSTLSSALFGSLQPFGSVVLLPGQSTAGSSSLLVPENAPNNINISHCELSALLAIRSELAGPLMKQALAFARTNPLLPMQEPCIQTWAQYEKIAFSTPSKVVSSNSIIYCHDARPVLIKATNREGSSSLDSNGTYVIAGGLGDLGRRLIRLMACSGARNFVTLSRSIPSQDLIQEVWSSVATVSSDVRIVPLKCNIANKDEIHDARNEIISLGLPPVRGLIQSAVILKDEPLETMKLETFQAPLQTKYLGTINLEEAFGAEDLDFFLMLSSAVNMIGSGAQANYNAGNAVLDGLAYEKLGSRCRYQSISLGFIEDTQAISGNSTRLQALQRQGLVPIESQELENFFTYSFRQPSKLQDHTHRVIGLGVDAIAKSSIMNGNVESPMFVHVKQLTEQNAASSPSEEEAGVPYGELSGEEKLQFITTKLCKQLAHMILYQARELDAEEILMNLGMDSLMAIELRNWIAHEFQAIFQSSEILDRISIADLAAKVLDRQPPLLSVHDSGPGISSNSSDIGESFTSGTTPRTSVSTIETMPQLPVPELESSLAQLLDSRRLFSSQSEIEELSEVVKSFHEEKGIQAQKELTDLYPTLDLQDRISDALYLQPRDPVPEFAAFFFNHTSIADGAHSQAQRCAIVSSAALHFRDMCLAGNLEADHFEDISLDTDSYRWLFHAAREPQKNKDRLTCGYANSNITVLRNGRIYLLEVQKAVNQLDQIHTLVTQFQHILENSEHLTPSVAILTGENRDVWADLREDLTTHNPHNLELLEIISHSAFVVCMDSATAESASERCNTIWASNSRPHARWWDKTLQLVVSPDGTSGMIGEHSRTDGLTHRLLLEHIQTVIAEFSDISNLTSTQEARTLPQHDWQPKELCIDTPENVVKHIETMYSTSLSNHTPVEYAELHIEGFGSSTFSKAHYPAKACALLTILLAITLWRPNANPTPIWEIVSQSVFKHGRIDWVQLINDPVLDFLQAARTNLDGMDRPTLQALWHAAVQENTRSITTASQGHGFVRHLYALKLMLKPDDPLPELFNSSAWAATVRGGTDQSIKIDALPPRKGPFGKFREAGFMMHGEDSCFMHYHFEEDDSLFVSVQTGVGRSDALLSHIRESVQLVRKLL